MKCEDDKDDKKVPAKGKKKGKPDGKMLAIALKESASKGFKPFKKA